MAGDLFRSTQSATITSSVFVLFCAIAICPSLVKGEEYEEGEDLDDLDLDGLNQDLPHVYDQDYYRIQKIELLVFVIFLLFGYVLLPCWALSDVLYEKFCTKPGTPNCLFLLHNRLGICKSCQGMEDLITIGMPEPEVPRSPESVVVDLRSEETQPCPPARSQRLFRNPKVRSISLEEYQLLDEIEKKRMIERWLRRYKLPPTPPNRKMNQFTPIEVDEDERQRNIERWLRGLPPLPPNAVTALKQSRRQSI